MKSITLIYKLFCLSFLLNCLCCHISFWVLDKKFDQPVFFSACRFLNPLKIFLYISLYLILKKETFSNLYAF